MGLTILVGVTLMAIAAGQPADQVKVAEGTLVGVTDPATGIRSFKGIPFAAPPVGDLRWREPQPAKKWYGARKADKFGPRAMQPYIFTDMVFRSDGMSEDCLYLNVWTPAKSAKERLPVLVYFYGGGFVAGDGSEPRYDGENMARKGMVAVTVNYRLNIFGFFAHPELSKESPHHASGNYGLLDQAAALAWVHKNIAAFGGDPKKITIAGESAGSLSVSAQMVSPLSKGLIAGAIGESGALIEPTLAPVRLADAEKNGAAFAESIGKKSLAELRAMPAQEVLDAAMKAGPFRFGAAVDGYFLPKKPADIFAAGEQAHVPLLVGWNSEEVPAGSVLGAAKPTPRSFTAAVKRLYGDRADEVLKLYPASTPEEARIAAADLGSDRFIVYSTWKWMDLHRQTGGKPVYAYIFAKPRPASVDGKIPAQTGGASHAAEIEYALGNLDLDKVYAWTPEDRKASETMQAYFANFIKTGDPNGGGLPAWPATNRGSQVQMMRINTQSRAESEQHRDRYLFLDSIYSRSP